MPIKALLIFWITTVSCSGCFSVKVPELPEPPKQEETIACQSLYLPSAIPDNVLISISPGKAETTNKGGQELLNNYRSILTLADDCVYPLAGNVYISIEPGKPPKANAGGQELIRNYAALRKRIKLWRESR
jgi:hypothetical protein